MQYNCQPSLLAAHLEQSIRIGAPPGIYEGAIACAVKNLAVEISSKLPPSITQRIAKYQT